MPKLYGGVFGVRLGFVDNTPVTLNNWWAWEDLNHRTSPLSGAFAGLSVSREFILTRLPKGLKLFAIANFHVLGN